MELVADGLRFPEGPVALGDGSVLVVEIAGGTVARITPDGGVTRVADVGGGPNGAALGPDGALYIANNGGGAAFTTIGSQERGWPEPGQQILVPGPRDGTGIGARIQRLDLATGDVTSLYEGWEDTPLRAPNDLAFDANGGFYFTDSGRRRADSVDVGALYYASADGRRIVRAVNGLMRPNGVALSPDGARVYVDETATGRLWVWNVDSPGVLRPPRTPEAPGDVLHHLTGWQHLDGIAVEQDGNVCVATLHAGLITVIDPDGGLLEVHRLPADDHWPTNLCFAGDDMRTVYVTSGRTGRLYRTRWTRQGLHLNFGN